MKKTLVIMLALVLTFAIVLAGCGGTKTDDKTAASATPAPATPAADTSTPAPATPAPAAVSGKITFATNRTDMDDQLKGMAAKFHEKYPDATVEIEPIKDYVGVLKVRLASNEAPDVMYAIGMTTNAQYADFFAPLDDMGFKGKTYIPVVETGGHVYSVNEGNYVSGVLYNKKTFTAAGITAVPKTLDEFLADLEIFKSKGILPLGSMVKNGWPLGNWQVAGLATVPEPYKVAESMLATDTPYTMDSPWVKEFQFVRNLVDKGYFEKDMLSSDWDVLRKEMPNGKTGMLMLANYGIGGFEGTPPDDVGFFPLPIDNSGQGVTLMSGGWNMVINKNTKNLATAKAFLDFWLKESGFQDYIGVLPNLIGQKPQNKPLGEFLASNPKMIYANNVPVDQIDKYNKIGDQFGAVMSKAQFGNETILQEVMLNKDANIQPILDKYNKKFADAKKAVAAAK